MAERSHQNRPVGAQAHLGTHEIVLGGERILLSPLRAAVWPARDTGIISDLHLGKTDCLAVNGIPVPGGLIESQIAALDELIDTYSINRLLIVGDLLHARVGLTPQVLRAMGGWRQRRGIQCLLVPGNHDRSIDRVAVEWGLSLCEERFCDGPFEFVHDPAISPSDSVRTDRYVFAGHIHPAVRLSAGGDSLRLPCFHVGPRLCILPAFSPFTGGVAVFPEAHDRIFAIAPGEVIEI